MLTALILSIALVGQQPSGWRVDVIAASGDVATLRGFSCVVPNNPVRQNGGSAGIGPAIVLSGQPVQLGSVSLEHFKSGMRAGISTKPLVHEARTKDRQHEYGAAGPLAQFGMVLLDHTGRGTNSAILLITPLP